MKQFLKIGFFLVALFAVTGAVQAQKYGYVNSQAILAELPEVKQMQANLEDLQTQLQKKGQAMLTSFQQKQQDAAGKKERGELSPVQEQELLATLQKEQQDLVKFEQEMVQKIQAKEQELLTPIYEKVNQAIQDVAKENGYNMIFDAAALLYAGEGADVSTQVKAKLGL